MAQHFLLSPAAKTLSLAQVFRLSDAEAEAMFRNIRWANTNGEAVCVHFWWHRCLRLPPPERRGPLPLSCPPQRFQHYVRHTIRLAQVAAARLSCGDCHVL